MQYKSRNTPSRVQVVRYKDRGVGDCLFLLTGEKASSLLPSLPSLPRQHHHHRTSSSYSSYSILPFTSFILSMQAVHLIQDTMTVIMETRLDHRNKKMQFVVWKNKDGEMNEWWWSHKLILRAKNEMKEMTSKRRGKIRGFNQKRSPASLNWTGQTANSYNRKQEWEERDNQLEIRIVFILPSLSPFFVYPFIPDSISSLYFISLSTSSQLSAFFQSG